jgi:hypothetical protein
MIYSNLKPGQYQFRHDGKRIKPEIGKRNAQRYGDSKNIANDAMVATEAQAVLTQAENLFTAAVKMDDSVFDLNNQDKNKIVLDHAPLTEDRYVDALGAPKAKGFISGQIGPEGGGLTFEHPRGGEISYVAGSSEDGTARITRREKDQSISIEMLPSGVANVEVKNFGHAGHIILA